MAARVVIQDGVPYWLSPSIIPSNIVPATPATAPTEADPSVNSTDVFVYVKAENTGTEDLGVCICTKSGPWAAAVPFSGTLGAATGTANGPNGQTITFNATTGDTLTIPGMNQTINLRVAPIPSPYHRAWEWSPDGRFLAYAVSNGQMSGTGVNMISDWKLSVIALQAFTRTDGTTVAPGDVVVTASSGTIWPWTRTNFMWVGSSAVLASGPGDPAKPPQSANWQMQWQLLCASAPAGANVWSVTSPAPSIPNGANGLPAGALDEWFYLVSPCELAMAFAARMGATGDVPFVLVSLTQAMEIPFRQNNVPTTVLAKSPTIPAINTQSHGANGVMIITGTGANSQAPPLPVDDPDCTAVVATTVKVAVDRVKASTLPTSNLGVLHVGDAAAGPLPAGTFQWVQVPNMNGWANQGEEHWCLLAQAFTQDMTTIPRPWDGQAATPLGFPVGDDNCAQHNFMIS